MLSARCSVLIAHTVKQRGQNNRRMMIMCVSHSMMCCHGVMPVCCVFHSFRSCQICLDPHNF